MKLFIKNRKNENISVLIEEQKNQKGLAIAMHGSGGFKEQPQIQIMAEAFGNNGYTVVRFDTTNTLGESDGKYEDATATNYYEDLEDVIKWSEKQEWFEEPFVLVGHSLGGLCLALYAENYPEKVKALAPISTVVSGKLSLETEGKDEWKKTGWKVEESKSKPGVIKRLPWSHMIDRQKYDILERVDRLVMPVLLIVGENDTSTPLEHQQILYEALPGKKELHVIKNAEHTFRKQEELDELKKIFNLWIKKL